MVAIFKDETTTFPLDEVICGDALSVLKTLPDCSVDAIVTDPPAGIAFMGKVWDNFSSKTKKDSTTRRDANNRGPGGGLGNQPFSYSPDSGRTKQERDAFISFMTEAMTECLRVLKPGGHALIWALPRTSHWTATAIEDAGFEIREKLYHIFGSGFPKSMNISKAIDKSQGAERKVIRVEDRRSEYDGHQRSSQAINTNWRQSEGRTDVRDVATRIVTEPATPEAREWDGWGTTTKPAVEEWVLARKPLSEKNIAENVLRWGVGGINIDQCRVGVTEDDPNKRRKTGENGNAHSMFGVGNHHRPATLTQGRFPSNLLLSHSLFCTDDECTQDCPIAVINRQSGITSATGRRSEQSRNAVVEGTKWGVSNHQSREYPGDTGGASRYFTQFCYTAKASRAERNRGCEGLPLQAAGVGDVRKSGDFNTRLHPEREHPEVAPAANHHPTVKPLALMSWLCRLITPPGGTVLDCFAGSGSTCVAALQEGFHFIGIEQEAEYVEIARARIARAQREM